MKYVLASFFLLFFSVKNDAQHCIEERYAESPLFDSAQIISQLNVPYGVATQFFTGAEVELVMDVYYPDPNIDPITERPFILNIHGGGFISGDKNELTYQSIEFARRGFVVANMNYRLGWNCDNVICVNCYGSNMQRAIYCAVQDARAALRFAKSMQADWGIDENFVFMSGESAGSITAMLCSFWDQDEANAQVADGFSDLVGSLDSSGNALTETFDIKAVIDQCGAIPLVEDMYDNPEIAFIGFHDSNDCVVPYDTGPLIACLCSGFLSFRGSHTIHTSRIANGLCSELHTAPQILPNHCTYPDNGIVAMSSCFLKRYMCGFCMNFEDDQIYATPICSALQQTITSVSGCTYSSAMNYNPQATTDDGTCTWMGNQDCPADLDMNGVVGVEDLIILIGSYGVVCD
ncbi:MAG: alpha/beta hydrolase [Flavobacteriales bacterium]|nr:alpha/beta hydrolase [Flavobacteriales bacterium]